MSHVHYLRASWNHIFKYQIVDNANALNAPLPSSSAHIALLGVHTHRLSEATGGQEIIITSGTDVSSLVVGKLVSIFEMHT